MRAKSRSVYAFRQVRRFMQESRGRFNPWEPLRPLPTMLWPSRFRAALTRETSPRQSHTGHSRTSPPRHALSGSPATLSTLLILQPSLAIYEKTITAKFKQPNATQRPQHRGQGVGWVLWDTVVGPVSTTQRRDPCLSVDSVARKVSATRRKALDETQHSRIQEKEDRSHCRAAETGPSRSPYALCVVMSPIGAGLWPVQKPCLLRVSCVQL